MESDTEYSPTQQKILFNMSNIGIIYKATKKKKFVYLVIQLWLTIKPKKNRKNVGFITLWIQKKKEFKKLKCIVFFIFL